MGERWEERAEKEKEEGAVGTAERKENGNKIGRAKRYAQYEREKK